MKTSLPLSHVTLTYGRSEGAPYMELTTADTRLTGKEFRVRIHRNSPTYQNLLALLEAENAVPETIETVPQDARIAHISTLAPTKEGKELAIGLGAKTIPVTIPLSTPHMLVTGIPGAGKTILLRTVVASLLMRPRTRLLLGTLTPQELGIKHLRKPDRVATDVETIEALVLTLQQELQKKKEQRALTEASGSKPRRVRKPHTFLVLDDLDELIFQTSPQGSIGFRLQEGKLRNALLELLQDGPRYGIYVVAAGRVCAADRDLIRVCGTRIVLGTGDRINTYNVLGQPLYEGQDLRPRGRGIVSSYGAKQKLFQSYFLPLAAFPPEA